MAKQIYWFIKPQGNKLWNSLTELFSRLGEQTETVTKYFEGKPIQVFCVTDDLVGSIIVDPESKGRFHLFFNNKNESEIVDIGVHTTSKILDKSKIPIKKKPNGKKELNGGQLGLSILKKAEVIYKEAKQKGKKSVAVAPLVEKYNKTPTKDELTGRDVVIIDFLSSKHKKIEIRNLYGKNQICVYL